ncbi:MAG: hypothetical protein WAJ87_12120, partial [Bryobacteraceae bacterium]
MRKRIRKKRLDETDLVRQIKARVAGGDDHQRVVPQIGRHIFKDAGNAHQERKLIGLPGSVPCASDPCGRGAVPYRRALRVLWVIRIRLANTSIYSIIRLATRLQRHVRHEFLPAIQGTLGCARQAESDI